MNNKSVYPISEEQFAIIMKMKGNKSDNIPKRILSQKHCSLSKEYQEILFDIEFSKFCHEEITISTVDYLKKLTPKINLESEFERKSVMLWQYNHVITLKTGDAFGDVALSDLSKRR